MRGLFSDWFRGEYAWVIAPLAVWMMAWLINTVILMIRRKQLLHPLLGDRQAGWIWKGTFIAAAAWAVASIAWLSLAPKFAG